MTCYRRGFCDLVKLHSTRSRQLDSESVSSATNRTTSLLRSIAFPDLESFRPPERSFEDRRFILFRSGKGGNPAPNTVRGQKKNGPAFGGHGGSVYLRSSSKLESLSSLPLDSVLSADAGGDGAGFSRGIHARDLVVDVPLGTIVRERIKTGKLTEEGRGILASKFVYQFLKDGDEYLVCSGGKGGIAPLTFKKGDGRPGAFGARKNLDLELRLINDVALIGFPNVGKSSLISALTSASIRIGPEPYTTTRPHLGTLRFRDGLEVKFVDLPGLTGHSNSRILRHMWRSRLIVYCVDLLSADPFAQVEKLREQVHDFDSKHFRHELVVATKCDDKKIVEILDSLAIKCHARWGIPVIATSARFGLGIRRLVGQIRTTLFPDSLGTVRPRLPAEITSTSIAE